MGRYKLVRLIVIGISLFFVALSPTLNTQAAQVTLTTSLIFMAATKDMKGSHSRMSLVKVDPDTLQMETFYEDLTANSLKPLKWSPDGKYLLFYRMEQIKPDDYSPSNFKLQLCLLTKAGVLSLCFERPPENDIFTGTLIWQIDTVTWSADSQSVFYAARSNDVLQLLEVDAHSGKQKQIVYDRPVVNISSPRITLLSWTPDLTVIGSGFSIDFRPKEIQPDLIYRDTVDGKLQHASIPIFDSLKDPFICLNFSPRGTYIAVLAWNPKKRPYSELFRDLYLLDMRLNVTHQLDENSGAGRLSYQCPAWQPNEQSFVFVSTIDRELPPLTGGLFKYSLADRKLSLLYEYPAESGLTMFGDYMAISPDGEYIAGVSHDNPRGQVQVKIRFPDGQIRAYLGDYLYTSHPVWGN